MSTHPHSPPTGTVPSGIERRNLLRWTAYGTHHLTARTEIPEPERVYWGYWQEVGPGEEILGDLAGRRVLDLCSGTGRFAAHLAASGARVDAVEGARSQHERAVARFGGRPGLRLIHADAVDHLERAEPYDVVLSAHGLSYLDPRRVLPALTRALRPGGRLVFSVLHTNSAGDGPYDTVTARPEALHLKGIGPVTVDMWVLAPALWESLVTDCGLLVDQVDLLASPKEGDSVTCTLLRARHPG
ncbi:class I SAM-dependent methyltransferase [Streptomyces chilikensis]|uniref:class I SAM-dependent methyltransferase n=1 Tax=Streptomyces chilikensis TaxID=1194079 RepID=UPI000A63B893|nr:class I SAM-dependent methyltransferase [Streptomyces chilikensis]